MTQITVKGYFDKEPVKQKFAELLGENSVNFINYMGKSGLNQYINPINTNGCLCGTCKNVYFSEYFPNITDF